ncbi:dihydrolipoyllysine-residue (2-methylpropanoyl)transferase [Aliikangiella marina]|uniref:Dihydrolipoamide acetyltransferase component of pyruvate dehydrogenase complex n=1 Tax=Aliikangiella marina TaxID=1712262 RepID=A0A545TE22_9GAMM|nr:2-oxo acid dehydrogenase subunit E2 [Aliikangiella marina]TQV75464.1 dihydrolipoyllysine-residue (2-methylpropanoyl)transferase [Aliikangiella marina]
MKLFNLPDLGEGLPDAEIVRWLVKEGDTVALDQPMVEMETAKAVVEVPSPYDGTITKLCGQPGDVIEVGAVLVEFDGDGSSAVATPAAEPAEPAKNVSAPDASAPASQPVATSGGDVFKLPDLGEGLPDAEIVRWLVKEGDVLALDQPMVEMETAKAVVEVPSPFSAKVAKLHGNPGDVIEVGSPLVSFGDATSAPATAEPAESDTAEESGDAGTVVGAVQVGNQVVAESASAVIKALARKLKVDLSQVTGSGKNGEITQADVKQAKKDGKVIGSTSNNAVQASAASPVATVSDENPLSFKASPAVRAHARRLGVALSLCNPTGKKGSITKADVDAATNAAASAPQTTSAPVATPSSAGGLPTVQVSVEPQSVRGVRRAMAMGMAKSHATVVPTTLMEDADITAWPKQDSLARYVRALVFASKVEPALNCWFDGEKFERLVHPSVHVGIAVDSPDGLYVPVVHDADKKDAVAVRARVQDLRQKIETKSLKQEDQQGATITLSNFGSIAGRYGTPVVSPPQVAILGTGRFRSELQLTDKGISKRKMLPLSLTFDHRACTGGEAARFLAAVIEDLQKPM